MAIVVTTDTTAARTITDTGLGAARIDIIDPVARHGSPNALKAARTANVSPRPN
jgi:hypothetical protein